VQKGTPSAGVRGTLRHGDATVKRLLGEALINGSTPTLRPSLLVSARRTRIRSMPTTVDEIAPGIYRLSTLVSEIGPSGFTFNQFLVDDDEPLLFHTGHRSMFPSISDAIEQVLPVSSLRWITFGHVESDECGAMNEFLAAAPNAQVAHGALGCLVSIGEMANKPPRPLADGEVLEIGSKRLRHVDTPHVPHGWEARVLFEETTRTLLCGDLFTRLGDGPAITDGDIVGPAMEAEALFRYSSLTPETAATMRSLGDLEPATLGLMHGSSFRGDGKGALYDLAEAYESQYLD
jgi:flavorubredoxin